MSVDLDGAGQGLVFDEAVPERAGAVSGDEMGFVFEWRLVMGSPDYAEAGVAGAWC